MEKDTFPQDSKRIIELARRLATDPSLTTSTYSKNDFYARLIKKIDETPKLYRLLAHKVRDTKYLTHEVEWVFDNYYIVQSVITDISTGLNKKYFKKLPQLVQENQEIVPRIYFLLSALVSDFKHSLDKQTLDLFIRTYQESVPLSLRELSVIPIVLKIILTEEIQQHIHQLISSLDEFSEAEFWLQKISKTIRKQRNPDFSKIISRLSNHYSIMPLTVGFHLLERLADEGQSVRPLLKWLRNNLLKQGVKIEEVSDRESRNRNALAEGISNTINSLRWIDQTRWDTFIGDINVIDAILIQDPAQIYSTMSTRSQDACRRVITEIADRTGIHEVYVARAALDLAKNHQGPRESHVGFYLIDEGRNLLERTVHYTPTFGRRLYIYVTKHASAIYLGSLLIIDIVLSYVVFGKFQSSLPPGTAWIFLILMLIVTSDIAVTIVNVGIMRFLPIRIISRMNFSSGIPLEAATFVTIPSMLRTIASAEGLVRRLEAHYLANKDENIFFALLMDFKDAPQEHMQGDEELVDYIESRIKNLNHTYSPTRDRFYVLHRKRIWNPQENVFMGLERKRGKLREFNELIRGKKDTSYSTAFSAASLPHISYIITIDEDTVLPLGTAQQLVGVIHHPLNHPVIKNGKVIHGYGIIQPRMSVRLKHAMKSLFSRLNVYAIGVDSYSTQIADIYFDLFGASIFQGKGIYHIDTVEATMGNKIPNNTILSHDLLEGNYARVGYASDIQLFENFPSHYYEYILRMSRWIRGDWQIISWIRAKKGFILIDRWKIFDNLRRSLILPLLLILIVVSWFSIVPGTRNMLVYSIFVLGTPFILSFILTLFSWGKSQTLYFKIKETVVNLVVSIGQIVIRMVSLFFTAIATSQSILTALWRMIVSRKNLLQWQTAHEVSHKVTGTLREFYRLLWISQLIPLAIIFGTIAKTGTIDFYIFFWNILWITSPFLMYILSYARKEDTAFSLNDAQFLRVVAVKTERFFLEQSTKENNFLIPDHAIPEPLAVKTYDVVSTSPTNIGMLLASLLTAYDFGHISVINVVERLINTFTTLTKLERFKGHLLNWYDIKHLKALNPMYVSTVDSANFLFSLIVLGQGLHEIPSKKVIDDRARIGIIDILTTTLYDLETLKKYFKDIKALKKMRTRVEETIAYLKAQSSETPQELHAWMQVVLQTNSEFQTALDDIKSDLGNKGEALYTGLLHLNLTIVDIQEIWKRYLGYTEYAPTGLRNRIPTFESLANGSIREEVTDPTNAKLLQKLLTAELSARELLEKIVRCEQYCKSFFDEADFSFLYNQERGLFHIGYNIVFNKIDNSYYDLMASEANAASFVAIMKNQVPKKHWFYLGRKMVRVRNSGALSSWGGSLFEYLTPLLYFNVHPSSLLGQTARVAIESHQRYARQKGTPWGMGEAAYNSFDIHNNYQYQIFGEPKLGLKRGLEDRLVVAPYTTAMSLPFVGKPAIKNMRRLIAEGVWGIFGFYDSIDYTVKKGFLRRKGVPVKIHYAHHEGFIAVAINNAIHKDRFRTLFHQDPRVRATEILLEEKMSPVHPVRPINNIREFSPEYALLKGMSGRNKQYIPLHTKRPRYAFLGNGKYFVGISNSGAGWSTYKGLAITRYREDPLNEPWGTFLYIHDDESKALWSPTFKPTRNLGKNKKIIFSENKAEFSHVYNKIDTTLSVTVPAKDNIELRTITLKNSGETKRQLTVMSFAELVMNRQKDDISHSSFQKLFINSKILPEYEAVVFERRDVQQNENPLFCAHFIVSHSLGDVSYIRNREHVIAGSDTLTLPGVFEKGIADESTIPDYTLDPVLSIAKKINLEPAETATVVYMTAAADSYEELVKLIKKYHRPKTILAGMSAADTNSKAMAIALGTSIQQTLLFQKFISTVLSPSWHPHRVVPFQFTEPILRSLWRSGVSGDVPYIVVRIKDIQDIPLIKSLLLFYKYVLYKGLVFDIIILNEYPSSYIKVLDDEIDFLLRISKTDEMLHAQGKVFHLKADLLTGEDKEAVLYMARVIIDSKNGSFEQQLENLDKSKVTQQLPGLLTKKKVLYQTKELEIPSGLELGNTVGGFDPKHKEYVITLQKDSQPKAPWVNFLTNETFGSIVNHRGASFTWSIDSYDNRLTAFHPDPLAEKGSEFFYLRDEETGEVWNPTPLFLTKRHTYIVRHGKGYSEFEHVRHAIHTTFTMSVPLQSNLKIYTLKLKNNSRRARKISLTSYHEVILGIDREDTKHGLRFERTDDHIIVAKNIVRNHFDERMMFFDLNNGNNSVTIHRDEFIGRYGDYVLPEALKRESLSGNLEYTAENCVALQTVVELAPNEEKEIVMLVGEVKNRNQIEHLISQYRTPATIETSLQDVKNSWITAQPFTLKTPDVALNVMFNEYTLYQMLTSRIYAKTGYYQPGGAFGFRDLLQDSMALVWSNPAHARTLITKAAEHQFIEGDVMNWWHEHNNFGIRTLFSDQHVWLPYVVQFYTANTGDYGYLDEQIPFMVAPPLVHGVNMQWTGIPERTGETATLYDHCVRALEYSLRFGHNKLPLIGAGDWNDGLNRTGHEGRGESVWLGWFMYSVFSRFIPICEMRGDTERAKRYQIIINDLKLALDKAWDGAWYRRAYLDNGLPLGSAVNREFKIDSIAQSWSVLSGAGEPGKVGTALKSAKEYLVTPEAVRLLAPPLQHSALDPGYIKNYPPGVRENGAQYNHAALWLAQAYFMHGDSNIGKEILDRINPFVRSYDKAHMNSYRVEPYILASDIYASPSYVGRGGWTWYTGSAGIFYRTIIENIVGISKQGNKITMNPCIPAEWNELTFEYPYLASTYHIEIVNPEHVARGITKFSIDDVVQETSTFSLYDDKKTHHIKIVLGKRV